MHLFSSEEANLCHLNSKWDNATRQAYSAEEAEIDGFLAYDEEFDLTEGTPKASIPVNPLQEHNIQRVSQMEKIPMLYQVSDSVSIFHPKPGNADSSPTPFPYQVFQPKIVSQSSSVVLSNQPIEVDLDMSEDFSKISDADSRLSILESQISHFHKGIQDLKRPTKRENQKLSLSHILSLLGGDNPGLCTLHCRTLCFV